MKGWALSCSKINKFLPTFVYFWTREGPFAQSFEGSNVNKCIAVCCWLWMFLKESREITWTHFVSGGFQSFSTTVRFVIQIGNEWMYLAELHDNNLCLSGQKRHQAVRRYQKGHPTKVWRIFLRQIPQSISQKSVKLSNDVSSSCVLTEFFVAMITMQYSITTTLNLQNKSHAFLLKDQFHKKLWKCQLKLACFAFWWIFFSFLSINHIIT